MRAAAAAAVVVVAAVAAAALAGCGARAASARQPRDPSPFADVFAAEAGRSAGRAPYILPSGPFPDPFTGREDPALNFNPYDPYAVRRRERAPPGLGPYRTGPIVASPPGDPLVLGVPVGGQ